MDDPEQSRPHLLRRLGARWLPSREPLPSLYDRHPGALAAGRHPRGIRAVPPDRIVGTARHPTQNTADFLPLHALRGRNWEARWQRIQRANRRLEILPPIELLQVGDEYWVVDGHNRVAAALRLDAAAIDADVTELLVPGVESHTGHVGGMASTLAGSEQLRQAGEGRFSATAGKRADEPSRADLVANAEANEAAEATESAGAEPPGE